MKREIKIYDETNRLKYQVEMDIAIKDLRKKHPEITDKDLERIFDIITHH